MVREVRRSQQSTVWRREGTRQPLGKGTPNTVRRHLRARRNQDRRESEAAVKLRGQTLLAEEVTEGQGQNACFSF